MGKPPNLTSMARKARKATKKTATKKRATKKKAAPKKRKAKKKASVVGKKWQVWKGTRQRTAGGLTKKDLRKSKSGKIVSKKQSQLARKRMRNGGISRWLKAVMAARKALKLTGFVACKKGTKYYRKARAFYKKFK